MDHLINIELQMVLSYSSDLDMIKRKISSHKPLNFKEIVKHKIRMFIITSFSKIEDSAALLLQQNTSKCAICNDVYHSDYDHFIIICDECVNVCADVKTALLRVIFRNDGHLSFVFTQMYNVRDKEMYDNRVRTIDIIIKIINNS